MDTTISFAGCGPKIHGISGFHGYIGHTNGFSRVLLHPRGVDPADPPNGVRRSVEWVRVCAALLMQPYVQPALRRCGVAETVERGDPCMAEKMVIFL